jgi:hypothetical protein
MLAEGPAEDNNPIKLELEDELLGGISVVLEV